MRPERRTVAAMGCQTKQRRTEQPRCGNGKRSIVADGRGGGHSARPSWGLWHQAELGQLSPFAVVYHRLQREGCRARSRIVCCLSDIKCPAALSAHLGSSSRIAQGALQPRRQRAFAPCGPKGGSS